MLSSIYSGGPTSPRSPGVPGGDGRMRRGISVQSTDSPLSPKGRSPTRKGSERLPARTAEATSRSPARHTTAPPSLMQAIELSRRDNGVEPQLLELLERERLERQAELKAAMEDLRQELRRQLRQELQAGERAFDSMAAKITATTSSSSYGRDDKMLEGCEFAEFSPLDTEKQAKASCKSARSRTWGDCKIAFDAAMEEEAAVLSRTACDADALLQGFVQQLAAISSRLGYLEADQRRRCSKLQDEKWAKVQKEDSTDTQDTGTSSNRISTYVEDTENSTGCVNWGWPATPTQAISEPRVAAKSGFLPDGKVGSRDMERAGRPGGLGASPGRRRGGAFGKEGQDVDLGKTDTGSAGKLAADYQCAREIIKEPHLQYL
eukprot:TRINITY_DN92894_c0_g1_i1.p1 TRINITY_DN92894_c0_g1~~TRINITY_DN92894_c0_g1_i1.p1  ORF type:complete len:377 (-),score=84.86 TRINITY_DN92894_c0_g1_i1:206-1336(-)